MYKTNRNSDEIVLKYITHFMFEPKTFTGYGNAIENISINQEGGVVIQKLRTADSSLLTVPMEILVVLGKTVLPNIKQQFFSIIKNGARWDRKISKLADAWKTTSSRVTPPPWACPLGICHFQSGRAVHALF
uniref:Uncharacterized protein n=1 Tax=Romanomermis culicivorax TaxID=13658 RepID=A0A915KBB6_ROMCU